MLPDTVRRHSLLAHQFDDLEQQKEVSNLGMWVFLATEVLFFGGLFLTYSIYRAWYPDAFAAAIKENPALGDETISVIGTDPVKHGKDAWKVVRTLKQQGGGLHSRYIGRLLFQPVAMSFERARKRRD